MHHQTARIETRKHDSTRDRRAMAESGGMPGLGLGSDASGDGGLMEEGAH